MNTYSIQAVPAQRGCEDAEPLVSILVPSYNHQQYVIDCLESIKRLDYRRLELIVSDDCSSDNTFEYVSSWIHDNATRFHNASVVKQQSNIGIVRNIQLLFDRANGQYLTCIASDDLLVSSGISDRVQVLRNNPYIDGVFGNVNIISKHGTVTRDRYIPDSMTKQLISPRLLLWTIIFNWHVAGPGLVLRRNAVAPGGAIGTLPANLHGEDRYIYVRLAAQNRLAYINTIVASYREVETSASRAPWRQKYVFRYMLESDLHNRNLMTGANLLALNVSILRHKVMLNSRSHIISDAVTFIWRVIKYLLKIVAITLDKLRPLGRAFQKLTKSRDAEKGDC